MVVPKAWRGLLIPSRTNATMMYVGGYAWCLTSDPAGEVAREATYLMEDVRRVMTAGDATSTERGGTDDNDGTKGETSCSPFHPLLRSSIVDHINTILGYAHPSALVVAYGGTTRPPPPPPSTPPAGRRQRRLILLPSPVVRRNMLRNDSNASYPRVFAPPGPCWETSPRDVSGITPKDHMDPSVCRRIISCRLRVNTPHPSSGLLNRII